MKVRPEAPTDPVGVIAEIPATCEPIWVATGSGVDVDVLRRADRHGVRFRKCCPEWGFEAAESELRAGWLLNGETARWRDVRETVRAGFERG